MSDVKEAWERILDHLANGTRPTFFSELKVVDDFIKAHTEPVTPDAQDYDTEDAFAAAMDEYHNTHLAPR